MNLVVQGKHFPAHRVVLAAASHFFSLMFTSMYRYVHFYVIYVLGQHGFCLFAARMMESMSHEVELRSAEPDIIELLLEFIYTAR